MALDNATAALVARSGGDPKAQDVLAGQLRQARRDAATRIPPERFTDVLIPVAGGTIGARVIRPGRFTASSAGSASCRAARTA